MNMQAEAEHRHGMQTQLRKAQQIKSNPGQRQDHTKLTDGLSKHACKGRVEAVQASPQHLAQEVILGNALLGDHIDQGPEGAVSLSLQSSPIATCSC